MRKKSLILLVLGIVAVLAAAFVAMKILGRSGDSGMSSLSLRLKWIPQSQFAGFLVAKELGFYSDVGLDVELRPGGPDIKPQVTVAARTDDIGIGVVNHVIGARSNGVPLVAIAQVFQDSIYRYVLKSENAISDLRDLRGKKVGLWLGGREAQFVSMLATVGMSLSDVQVIPQEFSVTPFLEDEYILSQVTVSNELNLIRAAGYDGDKLQILSPKDYDSAILGDVLFTTESFLAANRRKVELFLEASLQGWKFCLDQPEKALDIVLRFNPELKKDDQRLQMNAVLELLTSGSAQDYGIGYIDLTDYVNAEEVLFRSGQISTRVDPGSAIDLTAWQAVPEQVKRLNN